MSADKTTSEFTDEDGPVITLPPPIVRSTEVPTDSFSNRKGFVILAKQAAKLGYEVHLTYAQGWVQVKKEAQPRHSLVLRISLDSVVLAAVTWEAPVVEGESEFDADYKTRGALLRSLLGRFNIKELKAWLADPTKDPRDKEASP